MIPKHVFRARRLGVALLLAAVFVLPGIHPSRPGLLLLVGALVLGGGAAFLVASTPTPATPPANPATQADALANALSEVIDIYSEAAGQPARVAYGAVLRMPMRDDAKDVKP